VCNVISNAVANTRLNPFITNHCPGSADKPRELPMRSAAGVVAAGKRFDVVRGQTIEEALSQGRVTQQAMWLVERFDRGVEQTMQQLRALSRREITAADAGIFDAPTGGVLRICDQNP
jgi:hypothetical protein